MLRRDALLVGVALVVAMLGISTAGLAAEPGAGVDFFRQRVEPILARNCYECHGPQTQERRLRLDGWQHLHAGGASGPVVVPGQANSSLLVTAVRYVDDELQMPPAGKLSDEEIATLVRWIEAGAPHPDAPPGQPGTAPQVRPTQSRDASAAADHWAFRTPVRPPLPPVRRQSWPRSPVDRFVLAELEAAGIEPAPAADRSTLIRRITFDLTGLPPTVEELAAFAADDSESAVAALVDRLLASPRYGERWGRHWLDVARYADSNGLDENVAHGNAWRYRDYVIGALNGDKPYDQFVREQLAGDLLPTDDPWLRNERLIATGFLSLGPKVLAEVDERKMEMDIVDEQIDTVGRALLGVTLGCARCHDHKFDPITTKDYYALAGIFKSTHTMDSFTKIARWHENSLFSPDYERLRAEHDDRLADRHRQLDQLLAAATTAWQQQQQQQEQQAGAAADVQPPADVERSFPQPTRDALQQLRDEIAQLEKQPPTPPSAMGVCEGDPADVALHVRGSHLTLGELVPRSVPGIWDGRGATQIDPQHSGRRELAEWLTQPDHPLLARVLVNRLWRWHFGRGLVETTDNFGRLGARPVNAPLLDWLAVELVESGWSIKHIQQLIVLSATYQMCSTVPHDTAQADEQARHAGWARPRRLEAEELRDALLSVAGSLDLSMGGATLAVENRTHIFDHTSKDNTVYSNWRRSVYLPVVRNHLHDVFTLFDFTDASVPMGNRATSTVPSQALFLMNSQLVWEASSQLADRLLRLPGIDDRARIQSLYLLTTSRAASDQDLDRAQAYLSRFDRQLVADDAQADVDQRRGAAWRLLCQAILISNEFCYVR